MQNTMQISEQVTVGPQPTEEEIQQLEKDGFKTVVNFRAEDEQDQPLSPQDEGDKVEAAGMSYFHLPVSMKSMSPDLVDRFREKFSELPKPIFAHCQKGKRAGAMVMMHVACEAGMTGEQAIEKAKEMGFECDKPELVEFVQGYVDQHTARQQDS